MFHYGNKVEIGKTGDGNENGIHRISKIYRLKLNHVDNGKVPKRQNENLTRRTKFMTLYAYPIATW